MITFQEFKVKSRRCNYKENLRSHWFSGRIATPVSWILVIMGLTANQVTALVFICGIAAAIFQATDSLTSSVIGFAFYRLHVLFDVCDGEVARFRDQISHWGIYWDQMIHYAIYPLILLLMAYGRLDNNAELWVLIPIGIMIISRVCHISAKNLKFRVESQGAIKKTDEVVDNATKPTKAYAWALDPIVTLLRFDGLLFFYMIAHFVQGEISGFEIKDVVLIAYAGLFGFIAAIRVIKTPNSVAA